MPFSIINIALIYLGVISIAAAVITVCDKQAAKHRRRRVPEATLLSISFLGGSAAMLAVMLLIRHKTRHLKFMAGIPAILVLQLSLIYFISRNF